jgi:Fe2+ transport system protein B
MEELKDPGQWIILMSFLISVSLIILAITINDSMIVGQTTAESVLDFPKYDIISLSQVNTRIILANNLEESIKTNVARLDIKELSQKYLNSVVELQYNPDSKETELNFNNGVTTFHAKKTFKST